MPNPDAARQPETLSPAPEPRGRGRGPRRLWLLLPFVLVLLPAAGWSAAWLWLKGRAEAELDAAQARGRAAGYTLNWAERRVGGYPFRLDVTLMEARIAEPSGWAMRAPRLEAEAFAYALDRWVLAAPAGLTVTRPRGGPLRVEGRVLRASVARTPNGPRVSTEGRGVVFTPAQGAEPFALTRAESLGLHMRPTGPDQAQLWLEVTDAGSRPGGPLQRIRGGEKVAGRLAATAVRTSALRGADWPAAVRAWRAAGGVLNVAEARLQVGVVTAAGTQGALGVGYDGRLEGRLDLALTEASQALGALGDSRAVDPNAASQAAAVAEARRGDNHFADLALVFQAGVVTLGPIALGPAPRVY